MSGLIRILLIIGAILLLVFMLKRIRQSKLKIEYCSFWLLFSVVLIIIAIFPAPLYVFSAWLGFQSPINFVYLAILFILIVKAFTTTIHISALEHKIEELTQKIAVEDKEKRDKEK
ncbi:hypothetical protein M2454_001106 [Aequitasia blattaphilus]|uniref:DUF2304 domain-containing protein n=1 Tax=Aequitasia blattaphilus TaxID=2949332 RepID=A0ABT1E6B0_9FIRM|nr:DUF2304 domain-containing protein [Aequitasia blattaphilus]MCP1101371.1 DUF2304 domain-containing protein [Aequitasia blattaphilus]MCR8614011.1 DUF2304 domain-containing protein [Aequitasia blattaphilus]